MADLKGIIAYRPCPQCEGSTAELCTTCHGLGIVPDVSGAWPPLAGAKLFRDLIVVDRDVVEQALECLDDLPIDDDTIAKLDAAIDATDAGTDLLSRLVRDKWAPEYGFSIIERLLKSDAGPLFQEIVNYRTRIDALEAALGEVARVMLLHGADNDRRVAAINEAVKLLGWVQAAPKGE